MRSIAQLGGTCLFACALLGTHAAAHAQADQRAVLVLGVHSLDGDDDIALAATHGLRAAANDVQGWQVSDHTMSLSQMMLAHGCDEPDATCLGRIAQGAEAQLVVYGTLRRTSDAFGPLELTVGLFDASTDSTSSMASATFRRTDGDEAGLEPRGRELIAQLMPAPELPQPAPAPPPATTGTIRVRTNVARAEILVDGQLTTIAEEAVVDLPGVGAGAHEVEVRAAHHAPFVTRVTVIAGGKATVSADLKAIVNAHAAVEADDVPPWIAYALLGAAGAAVIGAISSAIVVNNIENDPLFLEYKDAVAAGNSRALLRGGELYEDACVAAEDGLPYGLGDSDVEQVADMCVAGSTAEVLQWVFVATAVVAGGAGTYLLLVDGDENARERSTTPTVSVRPSFDARSARLSATLRL